MANARQKLNELCTQRKLKWEYVKDAPPQQAAIKLHCAPEPITFTAAGSERIHSIAQSSIDEHAAIMRITVPGSFGTSLGSVRPCFDSPRFH